MGVAFRRLVRKRTLAAASLAALGFGQLVTHAEAQEGPIIIGALVITQATIQSIPRDARAAAGYVTIKNTGKDTYRLIGVKAEFSEAVEFHDVHKSGALGPVTVLQNGVAIAPGATVYLRPNSQHIMFRGLARALVPGDKLHALLRFEKIGAVLVDFAVGSVGTGNSLPERHDLHRG